MLGLALPLFNILGFSSLDPSAASKHSWLSNLRATMRVHCEMQVTRVPRVVLEHPSDSHVQMFPETYQPVLRTVISNLLQQSNGVT